MLAAPVDRLGIEPEVPPRVKRWAKAEYSSLVERGFFEGSPCSSTGATCSRCPRWAEARDGITRSAAWLVRTFDPESVVRIQVPFEVPGDAMPMPDGAIVSPAESTRLPHPNRAKLVIEVSDSSVELDREKAFEYAAG